MAVEFDYTDFVETFGKVPTAQPCELVESPETIHRRRSTNTRKRHSMFVRSEDVDLLDKQYAASCYQNTTDNRSKDQEDSNNNLILTRSPTLGRISQRLKKLEMAAEDIEDKTPSPAYRRLRRLSIRKLTGRQRRNSEVKISRPTTLDRTFSIDDMYSLKESRKEEQISPSVTKPSALPGWLASLTPRFERKTFAGSISPETPEEEHVPLSKANLAQYKGYLTQLGDKKENGQRFWCVLQDSCIYCYMDEDSEFADDVIALGGYHVISETSGLTANSKKSNQKYKFTLKRQGSKSCQFRCDSYKEVCAWVEHLRKEVNGSQQQNMSKAALCRSKSAREFSQHENAVCTLQRSKSDLEKEKVDIEKAKLLREVLSQQAQILEEQKHIEELAAKRKSSKVPVTKSYSVGMLHSHSDDFGYFSSYDTDSDVTSLSSSSQDCSPEGGSSRRSLSTVSGESTNSLCSIPEERKSSSADEINPEILAEIEEFEAFTKRELGRSRSNNL